MPKLKDYVPPQWKGYEKLEWSGVCRITDFGEDERHKNNYWAISDSVNVSGAKKDNHLYIHDEHGQYVTLYPVLSPGGGMLKNSDWEDIAVDGKGKLYILDNIANGGGVHQILQFNEPKKFGDVAKLEKIYRFECKEDVEAIFCYEGEPYIITKKANSISWTTAFLYLVPQQIYELILEEEGPVLNECSLGAVKELRGFWGFCTGADYYDKNMLLLHCYTASYLTDWPKCQILYCSNEGIFGQSEGACIMHDGKRVLVQNEKGEYQSRLISEFQDYS